MLGHLHPLIRWSDVELQSSQHITTSIILKGFSAPKDIMSVHNELNLTSCSLVPPLPWLNCTQWPMLIYYHPHIQLVHRIFYIKELLKMQFGEKGLLKWIISLCWHVPVSSEHDHDKESGSSSEWFHLPRGLSQKIALNKYLRPSKYVIFQCWKEALDRNIRVSLIL